MSDRDEQLAELRMTKKHQWAFNEDSPFPTCRKCGMRFIVAFVRDSVRCSCWKMRLPTRKEK